jgi:hypothetical protein
LDSECARLQDASHRPWIKNVIQMNFPSFVLGQSLTPL